MFYTVDEGILQLSDAQSTRSVGIYCSKVLPQLGVGFNGGRMVMVMRMRVRMGTMNVAGFTVIGHFSRRYRRG